jgi:predicted SAM-dependent methyltransferase
MKTLLRKIYYRIRYLPVVGELAQSFIAFVRNRGYGAARAVDWEQARQVSSIAERLEVVELLTKSQAHALTGLNNACKTLKRELSEQSAQTAQKLQAYKALIDPQMQEHTLQLQHQGQRTEFVRDEVLFELRKALKIKPVSAPGEASEQILTPRILDHVRLDVNQAVRLNVGCGHIPHPDKLNVDRRELPGVDVIAEADNLPFEPASIDLIYAAHLLEHFPRRYLLDVLLPYWGSLLKSDGVLQLVVPDAQAMLAAYKREEMSFATLTEVTFGKQDYDGDFHYAMYSPQTLTELLSEAGFGQIEVLADDRINGDCREMEIQARKS